MPRVIDERAALSIFARERDLFAAWPGRAAAVVGARLQVEDVRCPPTGRCGARDLAWADPASGSIHLLRRALALPWENVVGLLRHELGHLADPLVDRDGAELRADLIAAAATGAPVRYDDAGVQTVHPDASPVRDPWLHR